VPAKLSTTLNKLESMRSEDNRVIVKNFYDYMRSKDPKSDHHINNLLVVLISLDKFYGSDIPFTSINTKDQILTFLDHQQKDGKWIKREKDADGKYITSFNQNKRLLSVFFRWLFNSYCDNKPEEDWETPAFLKIKARKPLRESPYDVNDIWELEDILTIVSYEPELRNQAIITLLWDLDARPHEIIALRMRDIILNEQYGEGKIPSNTKTGGGPILLISSFTYVRDWINKHPFKNEPDARLICNLINDAPIKSDRIWQVLDELRLHIKRLVESGSIADMKQRQKLEHLLKVKKWNPYCFRHSAITDDSDHLPEYALTKKVRWVMGSKQASRYIKQRMGDELKNKILEHNGIKIVNKQSQVVYRTCGSCGYVNKLESKFCEAKGCHYPQTQLALDEIKAAEQSKIQELVNESNLVRDNTIQTLQQELKSKTQEMQSLSELCKNTLELSSKQNSTISDANCKLDKLMGEYNDLKGLFDKSMSMTKTAFGRIEELERDMRCGLLIRRGTFEDANRVGKTILQVVPNWKESTASGAVLELTPEEEQKFTELINQPKVSCLKHLRPLGSDKR
jgi:integrase/recombinase XerD